MKTGLIVEDIPAAAQALAMHLEAAFPGVAVERAVTLGQARAALRELRPDIAPVDIGRHVSATCCRL